MCGNGAICEYETIVRLYDEAERNSWTLGETLDYWAQAAPPAFAPRPVPADDDEAIGSAYHQS